MLGLVFRIFLQSSLVARVLAASLLASLILSSSCHAEGEGRYDGFEIIQPQTTDAAQLLGDSAPVVTYVPNTPDLLPVVHYGQLPHRLEDVVTREAPAYLESIVEPGFGTSITRVSSNDVFQSVNGYATHRYSKRQAWNVDETVLDVGYQLLDGLTLKPLGIRNPISVSNWSNVDPSIIYGVRHNSMLLNEFVAHNIYTGETELLLKLDEFDTCTLGSGEGNLTNDDRYAVLACSTNRSIPELLTVDILDRKVVARMTAAGNYNWVGFSQTGQYIVVENNDGGPDRSLVRYDKYFQNPILLSNNPNHGDFGIDENGNDVYVSINGSHIYFHRLFDGLIVELDVSNELNPLGFGHISCRNIQRPGWCYFSSYAKGLIGSVRIGMNADTPTGNQDNQSTNVTVTGSAEYQLWARPRSSNANYSAQPKASVSPSGTKIIFSSDWRGTAETVAYVVRFDKR